MFLEQCANGIYLAIGDGLPDLILNLIGHAEFFRLCTNIAGF
jgi:hypothetical protein